MNSETRTATLTQALKQLSTELTTADITVSQVQGKLYLRTRYTTAREWAQNVEKLRIVAKVAQERLARASTRCKADVGGFWNMGHFCKETVVMVVKVTLTDDEHTQVLLGGNP